jgi:single-stranded DNA-binding protein
MGRDICDLMVAVNRRYGRSDYLPCITWGLRARDAALWQVGDHVSLEGRIQSRGYIKLVDGQAIERTAFEVSVVEIEKLP